MAEGFSKCGTETDDSINSLSDLEGVGDTSIESKGTIDESDLKIRERVDEWKKEMKEFVSEQILDIELCFLDTLRSIEHNAMKACKIPANARKSETVERTPSKNVPDTSRSGQPDTPSNIDGLADLIQHMSVTQHRDSGEEYDADYGSLKDKFERFCLENKKGSRKLNALEVGMRTPLSEAILHFKLLLEFFVRDMFSKPDPGMFIIHHKLDKEFNSVVRLMLEHFNPLMMEEESFTGKAQDVKFLKTKIHQHLREFLSKDMREVERAPLRNMPDLCEFTAK